MTEPEQATILPSARQHKLYIWHNAIPNGQVSRFFFAEFLDRMGFEAYVVPQLRTIEEIFTDDGVRAYRRYVVVQWSRRHRSDEILRSPEIIRRDIERAVVAGLRDVFQWDELPAGRRVSGDELNELAHTFGIDWTLGRNEL